MWACPKCEAKVESQKQLTLCRLPPVLCIQLKRFRQRENGMMEKLEEFVDFAEEIFMDEYMDGFDAGAAAKAAAQANAQLPDADKANDNKPALRIEVEVRFLSFVSFFRFFLSFLSFLRFFRFFLSFVFSFLSFLCILCCVSYCNVNCNGNCLGVHTSFT